MAEEDAGNEYDSFCIMNLYSSVLSATDDCRKIRIFVKMCIEKNLTNSEKPLEIATITSYINRWKK